MYRLNLPYQDNPSYTMRILGFLKTVLQPWLVESILKLSEIRLKRVPNPELILL